MLLTNFHLPSVFNVEKTLLSSLTACMLCVMLSKHLTERTGTEKNKGGGMGGRNLTVEGEQPQNSSAFCNKIMSVML